jgi:hypothetical protein
MPSKIQINVDSDLLTLNGSMAKFAINMKIYEIIKTVLGEKFTNGEYVSFKDQHITKFQTKVVTFQDPLISIEYEILISKKPMNAFELVDRLLSPLCANIIVHKFDFIKSTDSRRIIYTHKIDDIIPFNIVTTNAPFKKHQIDNTKNSYDSYPWSIYKTNKILELRENNELYCNNRHVENPYGVVYDEGLLYHYIGGLKIAPINSTINSPCVRIKVPIKFEDIKDQFIQHLYPISLKPIDNYSTLFDCGNPNVKFADDLHTMNANPGDIIFIVRTE